MNHSNQHSINIIPQQISPHSPYMWNGIYRLTSVSSNLAWPVANMAFFVPVRIPKTVTINQILIENGLTNGNLDVGIYDSVFNRLVSSGLVAQAGANVGQYINVANTIIGPGDYYVAMSMDNNVGAVDYVRVQGMIAGLFAVAGCCEQAAAFPLPAVAAPGTMTQLFIPGLSLIFV